MGRLEKRDLEGRGFVRNGVGLLIRGNCLRK